MHKVELLAPASNLENLKVAILYGADAVYIGGEAYGLNGSTKDFTKDDIIKGIEFVHKRGKKLYVTVNVLPHNDDFNQFEDNLKNLESFGVDALIVSDAGVLDVVKKITPSVEIHLGSQANVTNYASAKFWHNQGVKRVVATRELSCDEIGQIRANTPLDLDIECFVHGEICISYSGRCLISSYIKGNLKDVDVQELRKNEYKLMEEKRPGEYYPVYEDERGTFLFNSKDLCMIGHISELIKSGINSLKIEARMKDSYYIASIVRAYRMAIDEFYKDPINWKLNELWLEEIKKGSYKDFTTGFYINENSDEASLGEIKNVTKPYECIGLIIHVDQISGLATMSTNKYIKLSDEVEIIGPNKETTKVKILELYDEDNNIITETSNKNKIVKLKLTQPVSEYYMLRRIMIND